MKITHLSSHENTAKNWSKFKPEPSFVLFWSTEAGKAQRNPLANKDAINCLLRDTDLAKKYTMKYNINYNGDHWLILIIWIIYYLINIFGCISIPLSCFKKEIPSGGICLGSSDASCVICGNVLQRNVSRSFSVKYSSRHLCRLMSIRCNCSLSNALLKLDNNSKMNNIKFPYREHNGIIAIRIIAGPL